VILLQAGTRFPSVIVFYVLLLVVFYLLLIRPQQTQQRKRRDMLAKIKKGDRIVTMGGLHATVHDVDDDQLTLELAPNLRVKADRGAVSYVRTRKSETPAASPVSESGPPRP
jgi:preprotein translocase subunit YajC